MRVGEMERRAANVMRKAISKLESSTRRSTGPTNPMTR
jgi:hypothetical protein